MIYTIVGNHQEVLQKREKILADLHKKRPDAPVYFFDKNSGKDDSGNVFSENILASLVGLQGLFEEKGIVVLDGLYSGGDSVDILDKYIDSMAGSQNMFIICEKSLNKKAKETLEKKSFKVEYIGVAEKAMPDRDNRVFSLAEKYISGDNIAAWAIFRALISDGIEPEQIHGILLWQVKQAFLVESARLVGATDKDAGINPFVFKKTLSLSTHSKMLKNYKNPTEINNFWLHKMFGLIDLYHLSRRGKYELADALEVEILNFC